MPRNKVKKTNELLKKSLSKIDLLISESSVPPFVIFRTKGGKKSLLKPAWQVGAFLSSPAVAAWPKLQKEGGVQQPYSPVQPLFVRWSSQV